MAAERTGYKVTQTELTKSVSVNSLAHMSLVLPRLVHLVCEGYFEILTNLTVLTAYFFFFSSNCLFAYLFLVGWFLRQGLSM